MQRVQRETGDDWHPDTWHLHFYPLLNHQGAYRNHYTAVWLSAGQTDRQLIDCVYIYGKWLACLCLSTVCVCIVQIVHILRHNEWSLSVTVKSVDNAIRLKLLGVIMCDPFRHWKGFENTPMLREPVGTLVIWRTGSSLIVCALDQSSEHGHVVWPQKGQRGI